MHAGGSVLICYCSSVPIDFQSLYERIVDSDDVGSDRSISIVDVSDLQSLVIEALELRAEVAAHIIDRQIHHWRDPRSEQGAHSAVHRPGAHHIRAHHTALHHAGSHHRAHHV